MPRKRTPLPREVFISHAHQDAAFVRILADVLRDHGVRCWHAEHRVLGAQDWHDEIGRALARCDWFVLVLSPRAVKSKWVKWELLFALREDRLFGKIVPVLYESCDWVPFSWVLPGFQFVDFRETHRESFLRGCAQLLRIWGVKFHRP